MTKKQMGACLVAGVMVVPLVTALAIWVSTPGKRESSSTRPLVQLPQSTAIAPAVPPARPRHGNVAADFQSLPDPRITSTLDDPGATFRRISAADGANNVVCGEVRGSGRFDYRRFVWIAEAQLLATDDGGPQFAHVAKLCDGRQDPPTP
jgi:hypothetical protein